MENQDEDRLKAVFDVCDENHNGYITVEHFKALVTDHFGSSCEQEVVSIVHILDPAGKGRISFSDFCHGVQQITQALQSSHPRTSSVDSVGSTTPTQGTQDFSYIVSPETPTVPLNSYGVFASPITDSVQPTDSALVISKLSLLPHSNQLGQPQPPSEDDHDSALSGRSSELNENSRTDITDEENYEDYGESEADITIASDISENSSSGRRLRERGLLNRHRKPGGSRRISSAAFARKLHRDRDSLGSGDEIIGDIDGDISDLNDKIQFLSDQIRDLNKSQSDSETRHVNLKDENSSLIRKIHGLEEQLREMEVRSDEKIYGEQMKHKDYVMRQDREKLDKLEYLTDKLQTAERDCDESHQRCIRLQSDIDKLKQDKQSLQERLSEVLEENTSLREDQELLLTKCQSQRAEFEQERCATAGLLDELGKELEELRKYKIEVEKQSRSNPGLAELPGKYQELQAEMQSLQEILWKKTNLDCKENRSLMLTNEDLNAQLIHLCMEEGRSLLQNTSGISWADEMDSMDKNELKEALKEQQDMNQRLKMYVDKMLLTIIEKQPSLLEVTHGHASH